MSDTSLATLHIAFERFHRRVFINYQLDRVAHRETCDVLVVYDRQNASGMACLHAGSRDSTVRKSERAVYPGNKEPSDSRRTR